MSLDLFDPSDTGGIQLSEAVVDTHRIEIGEGTRDMTGWARTQRIIPRRPDVTGEQPVYEPETIGVVDFDQPGRPRPPSPLPVPTGEGWEPKPPSPPPPPNPPRPSATWNGPVGAYPQVRRATRVSLRRDAAAIRRERWIVALIAAAIAVIVGALTSGAILVWAVNQPW